MGSCNTCPGGERGWHEMGPSIVIQQQISQAPIPSTVDKTGYANPLPPPNIATIFHSEFPRPQPQS